MHSTGPRIRCVLLSIALLMVSGAATGQEASFRSDVNLVVHSVAVLDRDGEPVGGLDAAAFRVYDDDVVQEIALFLAPDDSPLDVVLAMDSSGSLAPWGRVVRRAANTFLASLAPQDCALLLPFNDEVGPAHWGRALDPSMTHRVEGIRMAGGTILYDALMEALQRVQATTTLPATVEAGPRTTAPAAAGGRAGIARQLARETTAPTIGCGAPGSALEDDGRQRRRQAIVLLTDGDDRASQARFDEVLEEARRANVPIFPVVIGAAGGDPRLEAGLKALADSTGGKIIESASADTLPSAYGDVVAMLRASYLIGYLPPRASEESDAPSWHQVRVRTTRPSYRLIHRTRYYR